MEKIKHKSRQWEKPELIVMVRSKPEEDVLENCKFNSVAQVDVYASDFQCRTFGCPLCSALVAS